jgi:hypothetical protein
LISFGGIWKFPKEATLLDIREAALAAVAVVVGVGVAAEAEAVEVGQLQRKAVLTPV